MTESTNLYVDAPNGVMTHDQLGELFLTLIKNGADVDSIQLDSDADGTFVAVDDEVFKKAFPSDDQPAKRKPGRPRKTDSQE